MQSDERVTGILAQLTGQRDAFRSAVAQASEQLRALLAGYRNSAGTEVERAAFELGRFARGRIDPALFAQVFGDQRAIEPDAISWIDRAEGVLQEVATTTHLLQFTTVTPGGSLRMTIDRALARIGRAFGAARIAEYARQGLPIAVESQFLDVFPFALWTRAERKIGLPLIVEVDGRDLHVGGLEEFMDGTQIIVLVVNGTVPPAALVRLITPNVFVMQTTDVTDVGAISSFDGPAIIAIVPQNCAQFTHQRGSLELKSAGSDASLATLGRIGVFQQKEELRQLLALASPQPVTVTSVATAAEPAPEDVLAAWLLRQADIA